MLQEAASRGCLQLTVTPLGRVAAPCPASTPPSRRPTIDLRRLETIALWVRLLSVTGIVAGATVGYISSTVTALVLSLRQ